MIETAAIISTGTEIVQGLYADTNARHLAGRLNKLGLRVAAIIACPDDPTELEAALRHAASRASLVVMTGGLGPTEDDINRDVCASVFRVELRRDERAVELMRGHFRARGLTMRPSNERQALVPRGAIVLQNMRGTAPGFFLPSPAERGAPEDAAPQCALLALPGPPAEMTAMFEESALPLLRARIKGRVFARTRTIHTFGRPESELNDLVREIFTHDPRVTLTILAKSHGVDFLVTARAEETAAADALIARCEAMIVERAGSGCVCGADSETMQSAVARLLIAHRLTVSAAESCTGGLVAKMLTDTPGSSAYLKESYVVYSNEAKMRILGVKAATLESFGAVSEQTVREMAQGLLALSGADYAIAVTGIAGPDGGTPQKPAGLTYLALASPGRTQVLERRFPGDRELNRFHAALTALDMLRKTISGG
ncbi:MAG: competence/damage-inducible protein A [bacterium]